MSYNHPVRLRLTPLHGGELNDVTLRAALSPCAQSQGPGPSVDSATTHAMTGGCGGCGHQGRGCPMWKYPPVGAVAGRVAN